MVNEAAVRAMVDWVSGEFFLLDDKRARFREEVERIVRREMPKGRFMLYVDYDPWDLLLEAVMAAGIECSGCLNSAKGIFRFGKTRVMWRPDTQRVTVKRGYGAADLELWPNRDPGVGE